MAIPLHTLFSGTHNHDRVACYDENHPITWQEFFNRVTSTAHALAARPETRWLLSHDNPQVFATLLFALLHAGKHVVVPHNTQPGTLAQLSGKAYEAVATHDLLKVAPGFAPLAPLAPLDPENAIIELYTSGSTGSPKNVRKTLAQFDTEVAALESLWGKAMGDATVVATVPHHHIYGLLFRIFWPLSSGRPFDTVTCTYPDILNERLALFKDAVLISSPAQLSRLPALLSPESLPFTPRMVFSSGAPLQTDAAKDAQDFFGYMPTEIFGSTETGGIAWRQQDRGSAWTPMPGISIRTDTGTRPLLFSPFLDGHVPWTMDDAVELLEDGRFLLRGRLDRIVKIEEKRLSLPDMEACLASHPWVKTAAVLPLKKHRQTIGAAVVLGTEGKTRMGIDGKREISRQLRAHLAKSFEAVLLPKQWRFPDQLPSDDRGKLSNAVLASLFAQHDACEWLLPDIISVQSNETNGRAVEIVMHIPGKLTHFAGHFPELPILPGVVQVDWAVRLAHEHLGLTGEFKSMENIRFQAIVLPETRLTLTLAWNAPKSTLEFSYDAGKRKLSSGRMVFSGAA